MSPKAPADGAPEPATRSTKPDAESQSHGDSSRAGPGSSARSGFVLPTETQPSGDSLDSASSRLELTANSIPGYEILRKLSRGGQGIVYQAIQQQTKRMVAIKVRHGGGPGSTAAGRRFEREIELVGHRPRRFPRVKRR